MVAAAASAQTTISNVDQKSGWQKCSGCAGAAGQTDAYGYFTQYVNPYAIDGKAMKFFLGGSTPYRNALWSVNLNSGTSAHHFIYDVYFYITNPSASMALEWDLNLYSGGKAYIFGVQCNAQAYHQWTVWNPSSHTWVYTGVSCPAFPSYKWNHVVEEFEKTTDGHLHFVAITYNGVKHYINKYFWPTGTSWSGLGIDYQMDGNKYQTAYATWLDKINVTYW